jgi:simple sugar transport system permease protein
MKALFRRSEAVVALVLLLAMIGIGALNPAFFSLSNLFSLARSNVVNGIMALGVLTVMISGGIDVSFPAFAIAAMYLTIRLMLAVQWSGVLGPFLLATAIGLALGLLNAALVHGLRMIPLIVTLGTGALVRGALLGLVGTSQINIDRMPPELIRFGSTELVAVRDASGAHIGLSAMILIYLALALLVHLFLGHTLLGRGVYAYGDDREAARRAGFSPPRIVFTVYGLAGALAGFAGLLHASMIWLANPRDFIGLELDVIAAVVLGGASIFGGRGSVPGTMLGVFLLVMISNSLILMHIPTTWQRVVVGLIVIAATAITSWRDRRRLARGLA